MTIALIHLAKFSTPLSSLKYPLQFFFSDDVNGLFLNPYKTLDIWSGAAPKEFVSLSLAI